jgi:hypothetical protein
LLIAEEKAAQAELIAKEKSTSRVDCRKESQKERSKGKSGASRVESKVKSSTSRVDCRNESQKERSAGQIDF